MTDVGVFNKGLVCCYKILEASPWFLYIHPEMLVGTQTHLNKQFLVNENNGSGYFEMSTICKS